MQISVLICPVYINKNYLCVSESRKTKEMEQIDNLKELINQGDVDTAIKQLDQLLRDTSVKEEKDTLYYLRGNAYRKKGDWKQHWTTTSMPSRSIRTVLPLRPGRWQ